MLGLPEPILRALKAEGYETPTPIQAGVIPAMLDGNDLVGIAQTGTGKTAAFVLPLLAATFKGAARPQPKCCRALVLAPTRELAAQIEEGIRTYGQFMKQSSAVVVGGVKLGPQVRAMARGVDILVATPGRLEDHMGTGAIRLDETTTVVLDEADQMLDLGFLPAIRRILAKLPKKRQTALLSATMPKQIRALAADFLNKPVEVSVAPQSKPIDRIEQSVIYVPKAEKRQRLVDVLKAADIERAVVFTRTKHGANKVAQVIEQAGMAAGAIHGNKSQSQRVKTLDAFKDGSMPILVATDIAARGIDVDGVSHVVNFDLPNVSEVYVHRIGRTARAGASGIAVALVDEADVPLLRDIEKLIGQRLHVADGDASALPEPEEAPAKNGRGGRGGRGGQSSQRAQGSRNTQGGNRRQAAPANDDAASERTAKPKRNRRRGNRKPGEVETLAASRQPQRPQGQKTAKPTGQPSNSNGAKPKRSGGHRKGGNGGQGGGDASGLTRMLGNIDRSQARRKSA